MAKFTVTLHEIAAHTFTVEARSEEDAIELARSAYEAQVDSETCISLGLDPRRPPTVAPARNPSNYQAMWERFRARPGRQH